MVNKEVNTVKVCTLKRFIKENINTLLKKVTNIIGLFDDLENWLYAKII